MRFSCRYFSAGVRVGAVAAQRRAYAFQVSSLDVLRSRLVLVLVDAVGLLHGIVVRNSCRFGSFVCLLLLHI